MKKDHFSHFEERYATKSFGMLNGIGVFSITLTNKNGMELSVMNYGAAITSLKIPISTDEKVDLVLGFDNLAGYIDSFDLESAPYLGAVVGPFAGRIKNGAFALDGQHLQLDKNHGNHHLHGGNIGLSRRFWDIKTTNTGENPSITLSYSGEENEGNYPGKLTVETTYILTETNELKVVFHVQSTKDTIVNLTQHSYFNLDGHLGSVANQQLQINATKILDVDKENIPTGILTPIDDASFDYSEFKNCPISIDNTFILNDNNKPAATLFSELTKLKMSVFTNQPAVHVYVGGNCFGKIKGKQNADYHTQSGICFETQNFPDAPNHAHFPSAVLKKNGLYSHETAFKFEIL